MIPKRVPARRPAGAWARAIAPVFIVSLALGGSVAGCSGAASGGAATSASAAPASTSGAVAPAPAAEVPMGDMHMPTAEEVTATWQARPEYVKALDPEWQGAYAFALARPDVLQWLPCYCGCGGMGHRSNLDCFFQRREVKGTYQYEEHASFCDICVKTANMAAGMLQDGKTMVQIRAAVDATFAGSAPGTDTALPPA